MRVSVSRTAEIQAARADEGPERAAERDGDRRETRLARGPSLGVSIPVMLLWLCALLGLGAYVITVYLPDVALGMN